MATINLGAIKFNWKGAYNSSTSYAVDDVVSSGGNSYVCIQAHSNQAVGNATAYWNIMSSAGTNGSNGSNGSDGTDLSTTLTTQSDLLYRDGSGLQRLPKGTAGQTLQMNSGANAPTWTTVAAPSADWVKVGSTNVSSGVTLMSLNYFSSTYNTYRIIGRDIKGNTTGDGAFNFRVNVSNSAVTTGDKYSNVQMYMNRDVSGIETGTQGEWKQDILNMGAWDMPDLNINNAVWYIDMTFYNVNTSKYKVADYAFGGLRNQGDRMLSLKGTINVEETNTLTGVTIYKSNSTLDTIGHFTVYGLKE